jgi:hypothetical protein
MNELLENYQALGLVSSADRTEILAFLKEQSVDVRAPLPKVQWQGDKLSVLDENGKAGLGYKFESPGVYRTAQGRVVNVKDLRNGYELYTKMFLALSQQNSVSRFSLVLSVAEASGPNRNADPSIGAGAFLLDHALRITGTLKNTVEIAGYGFFGVVGNIISAFAWPYRHFSVDGKVTCDGPRYTVVNGFNAEIKEYLANKGPAKDCAEFEKQKMWWETGESENICKFAIWADRFFEDSFKATPNQVSVKDAKLESILKKNPAPACNAANAAKVEAALKTEIKSLGTSSEKASSSSRSGGKDSSSGAGAR